MPNVGKSTAGEDSSSESASRDCHRHRSKGIPLSDLEEIGKNVSTFVSATGRCNALRASELDPKNRSERMKPPSFMIDFSYIWLQGS